MTFLSEGEADGHEDEILTVRIRTAGVKRGSTLSTWPRARRGGKTGCRPKEVVQRESLRDLGIVLSPRRRLASFVAAGAA